MKTKYTYSVMDQQKDKVVWGPYWNRSAAFKAARKMNEKSRHPEDRNFFVIKEWRKDGTIFGNALN